MAADEVFHIRRRLPRKGGNSFYRDTRVRQAVTYCGAEVTAYDAGWRDKVKEFDGKMPCEECIEARRNGG